MMEQGELIGKDKGEGFTFTKLDFDLYRIQTISSEFIYLTEKQLHTLLLCFCAHKMGVHNG